MDCRLLSIATQIMVIAIIMVLILLIIGIGVLVLLHICIVGCAFRRGLSTMSREERCGNEPSGLSSEEVDGLPCYEFFTSCGGGNCVVYLERVIFSWSLEDIYSKDLFKHNVVKIPNTFKSLEGYFMSFVLPFLEELRADLNSCFEALSQAPFVNILTFERINLKKTSSYRILVGTATNASHGGGKGIYKPKSGDVFVLSNVKPTDVSDLNQYDNPYNVALVTKGGNGDEQLPPNTYIIISSNAIDDTKYKEKEKKTNFSLLSTCSI